MDFIPEDRAVKMLVPVSGYLTSRTHQAVQPYCLHHCDNLQITVCPTVYPNIPRSLPPLPHAHYLLPTYLPAYLPTHLPTHLPTCLPVCLTVDPSIRPFIPITGQQPNYVFNYCHFFFLNFFPFYHSLSFIVFLPVHFICMPFHIISTLPHFI